MAFLGNTLKTLAQRLAGASNRDGAMEAPAVASASLRAPIRTECIHVPVTTSSVRFRVPNGSDIANVQVDWRGRHVNVFNGTSGTVYIQFSEAADAAVNEAQVSATQAVSGATALAAAGDECWPIPAGQWIPVKVPDTALTFAVKGAAAGILHTHLSET